MPNEQRQPVDHQLIAPREQSCGADYGGGGRSEWLDIDWQQHARWLRIEDRWLHIVDVGEGPVLLLVHGLSGCWKNWLENIPHFARDHRVIAIDLPGFGESEMPAKTICIGGYADTIDTLMSELGIDSARIVGNSMGGFIAAELAIRYPARVERLVLVDAAGLSIEFLRTTRKRGVRHHLETVALCKIGLLASRSALVARRRRLRNALLLLFVVHPSRLAPELAIEQVGSSGKPGFPAALQALCSYPIRERLADIACPTLIVWGGKDRLVPVKDATLFEQLIADARKIIYADTGHLPMLERPSRFNADVGRFLQP
jgi:pimeloyl-ACP methyl ester carboxylesterase